MTLSFLARATGIMRFGTGLGQHQKLIFRNLRVRCLPVIPAGTSRRRFRMCVAFRGEIQAGNTNVGMVTNIECVCQRLEDFGEVRDEGEQKEGGRCHSKFLAWTLGRHTILC